MDKKQYGIIAYYSTSFEGDQLKQLFIDVENADMNSIWDIAKRNENSFPDWRLIKVELIPTAN